jgi:hypothetical protein
MARSRGPSSAATNQDMNRPEELSMLETELSRLRACAPALERKLAVARDKRYRPPRGWFAGLAVGVVLGGPLAMVIAIAWAVAVYRGR